MTTIRRRRLLGALTAQLPARVALSALAGALVVAPASIAAPGDVADLMNRMRTSPGKCIGQPALRSFVRSVDLDHAAAKVAGGASLEDSARAAGHVSVAVKSIIMSASTDSSALEPLLASHYCELIVDPGLAGIGIRQPGLTTTVLLAAAFAPAAGLDESGIAARVLALVNEARSQPRQCGSAFFPRAEPVRWNDVLSRAAKAHSEDMARNSFFAHNSPDGTTPAVRVERTGYDYAATGENIAAGQMTPEAVVASWVASSAHCANLMHADFTEMGVAMASNRQSAMGIYWTQVFGTPRISRPATAAKPARS